MASNGMVARALVKMTDIFSGLVELLHRRPSSYWFVLNSEGKHDSFYYQILVCVNNLMIIHWLLGYRGHLLLSTTTCSCKCTNSSTGR